MINDLNNLRTEVENAFYQNENNNDTTTWNTPESFYKSTPYLIIVLYVYINASFDLCSSPFNSSLFSSEANISATSIQDSLNDLILVSVPLLLRILTLFFLAARSTIFSTCSVLTVAALASMITSSQNVVACMTNEINVLILPSSS